VVIVMVEGGVQEVVIVMVEGGVQEVVVMMMEGGWPRHVSCSSLAMRAVNALLETPMECSLAFAFMLAGYPASVLIERARLRQQKQQQQQLRPHAASAIELQ
jgi:hypothetical protein